MRLKYTFSSRERALLVALAFILVGVLWYNFVYSYCTDAVAEAKAAEADAQAEVDIAQTKLTKMTAMQAEIDRVFAAANGNPVPISSYDNVEYVISELNTILATASVYELNFADVKIADDGIVRRGVDLSFGCSSYEAAKAILVALEASNYRCEIDNLSISQQTTARGVTTKTIVQNTAATGTGSTAAEVNVRVHLTYFETSPAGTTVTKTTKTGTVSSTSTSTSTTKAKSTS